MATIRPWLVLTLAASMALVLVPSCGYHGREAGPPATLHPLPSLSTLERQFNQDAGTIRLILLFSPT